MALVLMIGVFFVITRFTEISHILEVIQRGNLLFLGLALLAQFAWIFSLSSLFQSIYTILEMDEKRLHLVRLVTAANFLNIVAPSAGLSGLAVFISDARRRGRSTARVTIAGLLYVWFDYWGILVLLALGLGDLQERGALHWAETTAALMMLALALGMTLLLYLGLHSAQALGKVLSVLARAANFITYPILRRHLFGADQAPTFAREIAEGLSILRYKRNWVLLPFLYSVLNKLLLVVVLGLCFLAFSVPVEFGTIVSGLALAQLFMIMSPTPSGLGFVEGVLTVAFTSLGVPLSAAAVVTLVFHAFSFWTPFLTGMISLRSLDRQAVPAMAD